MFGCGPDPIIGKWRTNEGGGLEFLANGTCRSTIGNGAPLLCSWRKQNNGDYSVQLEGDVVETTVLVTAHVSNDKLVFAFSDKSKPVVLKKS
jgi:hypothetical protein